MMRYVRTIDKTTEVATPRGVTPCSSDLAVEERMENAFTFTLKFLPVGRIPQQNPLTLSFLGSNYNIVLRLFKGATRRRLQFLFPCWDAMYQNGLFHL